MGSIFEDVAGIGRGFLSSTSADQQVLQQYTYTLSQFCDLVKHTHRIVVKKLEAVEDAQDVNDARAKIGEVRGEALMKAFRGCGLCDVFEGYGKSLRRLLPAPMGGRQAGSIFPGGGEGTWHTLCDALEAREAQVANLYVQELQDIVQLSLEPPGPNNNLARMKELASKAKAKLTVQRSDFEALSQDFQSLVKE